jgi:hypothetical protein
MARTSTKQRANIARVKAAGVKRSAALRKGPLIPLNVLQQLGNGTLPLSKTAYQAKLNELLGAT